MYEITRHDRTRGKRLLAAAIAAPLLTTSAPIVLTLFLLLFASGPPAAAVMFFFGAIATFIGLVTGLVLMTIFLRKRYNWTREMRDRIAADGIKAEEIEWFRRELNPQERRSLKQLTSGDPLLLDAYRETLASRLTAARIIQSSRRELQAARKRHNSVKNSRSAAARSFLEQTSEDIRKLTDINDQAKQMLSESTSRLRMIEAAASRQGSMVDNQVALEKLRLRASELPLALQEASEVSRVRNEISQELKDQDAGAE